MRRTVIGSTLIALVLGASPGVAQVAWDSPMLMPPDAEPGVGLYLMDVAGGELGVMLTWRSPAWNFGVRGGVADDAGPDDDIAIFAGLDFSGAVTRSSDEFPLNIDWVLGAGISAGDDLLLSAPLGLTVGHSFTGDGVVFTPYATPRVVLDAFFGDGPGDDVSLDFVVDIGLDLRFSPTFTIRFGATLGDREAVAIGAVF